MAMSTKDREKMQEAAIKALGHPLRRQILRRMEEDTNGGLSPSMLAEELGAKLGNLSYHVRELAALGVLKEVGRRPARGAIEHIYKRSGSKLDQKITEVQNLVEQK